MGVGGRNQGGGAWRFGIRVRGVGVWGSGSGVGSRGQGSDEVMCWWFGVRVMGVGVRSWGSGLGVGVGGRGYGLRRRLESLERSQVLVSLACQSKVHLRGGSRCSIQSLLFTAPSLGFGVQGAVCGVES